MTKRDVSSLLALKHTAAVAVYSSYVLSSFGSGVECFDAGDTMDRGCRVHCHVCGTHAGCHGTCALW